MYRCTDAAVLFHSFYIIFIISLTVNQRTSDLRIMANISLRSFLGLLLGIQYLVYAEGQGRLTEKYALIGQQVDLRCYLNSTEDVTWLYSLDDIVFSNIYICQDNQNVHCTLTTTGSLLSNNEFNFQASRWVTIFQFFH